MAYAKPQTHPFGGSEPAWRMRPATEADMRWLAPRLYQGSVDEIAALSKFQPISVLLKDRDRKAVIYDLQRDSQPVAVFDIAKIDTNSAAFWAALTENAFPSYWFSTFVDRCTSVLNLLNDIHPNLLTYVDQRNIKHRYWLEGVGFKCVEAIPQYGRKELPFLLMSRTKTNV